MTPASLQLIYWWRRTGVGPMERQCFPGSCPQCRWAVACGSVAPTLGVLCGCSWNPVIPSPFPSPPALSLPPPPPFLPLPPSQSVAVLDVMSIVIALGVTTPETSYSDMAAGSDPESVEASPAVNEKNYNHSCGSAQSHGYRGLPFAMQQSSVVCCQDHNYDSDSSSEDELPNSSWCQCSLTADSILIKCDHCRDFDSCKRSKSHRNPENISAGESSATESGDEESQAKQVQKRKKSTEKTRGVAKTKKVKAFREGSRKSMRMKNSTTDSSVLDENTSEGWECKIRKWTDQYEEALANQYSADVQSLLQLHTGSSRASESPSSSQTSPAEITDTINRTALSCNNTVLGSQMQLQLGRVTRVQKHRKILRAAKTLEPDTLIIEYRGKVMLKQQFEVNGHFFKKPYPFVLFYSKYNDVEMCVDARTFGNDARFIRRSCTPNAEVRHMIAEGMIHLCIYAVSQIIKDSEVTIGFDFEFNSCNYKVDCACHKGNENCPVQKHNLNPTENFVSPPSLLPPAPLIGAETRRRKARRKEQEGSVGDSNQSLDQHSEAKEGQGASDTEEKPSDELKVEEKDNELFENGVPGSSNKTLNIAEKRRKKTGFVEQKEECIEAESRSVTVGNQAAPTTGVGMSTRRTTYVTDPTPADEKSAPNLPAPVAAPKPARPAKNRPKGRISRCRSSSSQRARRQRQALAQQAAAAAVAAASALADQGAALEEEASQGPYGAEQGEGVLGSVGPFDGDGQGPNCIHRGNFRYPKTKKYLVTEWLNDKVPGGEKVPQELPVERPLRITTDPTVLATTLNMLPGLSHTSMICTTPRHYIRFGSPFNPERRRPRPLQMDGTYGCYKKRWIKQMEDESCSVSVEDGTESTMSQKSTSSRSTPNPLSTEVNAPIKKRRSKYLTESTPATTTEHLLRPLSPITPPPPEDAPHLLLHPHCLLSNGLPYSPMPSLPTSRCNTPLQFENISSPEASPIHRPESISPEPCVQADYDISRPQFLEVSLSSSLGSPTALMSDEYSLPGGAVGPDSQCPAAGTNSLNQTPCLSSDLSREQTFKTEFNLIYTCSPLNANLGNTVPTDQRLSKTECFSPAESLHSSLSGHGLMGDHGSMSPYGDTLYGGMYPDSGTPPHMNNPPQKKKRAKQSPISLVTGKAHYQTIAVRSEYKTVQNMVSLLEYRKRKQSCGRDPESLSATHTPPAVITTRTLITPYSSPHTEAVSPSEPQTPASSRQQDNQWMVPTSVERLREGQGVLERVLRSIKSERTYKHGDGSSDKECEDLPVSIPRFHQSHCRLALALSPLAGAPFGILNFLQSAIHQQTDSRLTTGTGWVLGEACPKPHTTTREEPDPGQAEDY
ncbi:hypothetical protein WMY93_011887 [Mugilogobius chulae]|uniref:SET domain-containing protein n=1 Tax=Mugilogobius chulae TaxID=88201 RepID=A0AAW0PF17_9GOBI